MKMWKKRNEKGFTLAELLIVVAIIAVLVAIAIPVFSNQLEKSRDATSIANIRSAYAETATAVISSNGKAYNIPATGEARISISAESGGKQTATIKDIRLEGQTEGFSGEDEDIAFSAAEDVLGDTAEAGGKPGKYTAEFTFNNINNSCVLTKLTPQQS